MKQRIPFGMVEQGQRRVGADDVEELFVIDVKRPSHEGVVRCPQGSELLGASKPSAATLVTKHERNAYRIPISLRRRKDIAEDIETPLVDNLGLRLDAISTRDERRGPFSSDQTANAVS